jgi:uracil-DNA glycosylase
MKCWDYYFKETQPKLEEQGGRVLPTPAVRFKAFELGLPDIKVIVVGREPYTQKGLNHGLSFSTLPHVSPLPSSIRNLLEEASEDVGTKARSGDLRGWHSKGVFLYNAALTVEENKPKSHIKLWERFTYETLRTVSECRQPIAWLLWGKEAQQYKALVPPHHLYLGADHPGTIRGSFRGCRHFSQASRFLGLDNNFWSLE